jgi:adenine-specific DNA-methyltransferase
MKKLTAEDAETRSPDVVAENVEQLKTIFPEAFTEEKVDFEVLKQLLGGVVEEREEKYGLNWHGKRRARQLALTPSTGTLRPCLAESVDWDTTRNLMIEGDNLEVLKLLQKSYSGKVKLIYIDPPYNTGKDFVYPDDFQDNIKNYLELTGQVDGGGNKLSSNTEASGRYHTDWLNMMYPRLKLARNLLGPDGALFISIDDCEVSNLRRLCDDVFGEENFVGCVVWQKKYSPQNDAQHLSELHEYVVAYALNAASWRVQLLPRSEEGLARYKNPDNDPRGPWKAGDFTTKTKAAGHSYPITSPSGKVFLPTPGRQWGPAKETFDQMMSEGRVWFGPNGSNVPALKQFLSGVQEGTVPTTLWLRELVGDNQAAMRQMAELGVPFDSPKPVGLIQQALKVNTTPTEPCIILDFFAGSGTTGHAVVTQNQSDGGSRRYVLVQLPEPLDATNIDQKAGAEFCDSVGKPRNIAEITKERLRRAGKKVREENPMFAGDLGFRVFKLASSNIRAWDPNRDDLPTTLHDSIEHLKTDRTEQDILFELLLKLGLDLTIPIEQKSIAGKAVHNIGAGTLLVCLAEQIAAAEVELLALGIAAWHKELAPAGETTVVFRDSAFADDVAKTNLTAILQQHGLENVRSL